MHPCLTVYNRLFTVLNFLKANNKVGRMKSIDYFQLSSMLTFNKLKIRN